MAAEPGSTGLETPEELREVILAQRRELDALRRETADVAVLTDALEALLRVGRDEDPFASVFSILEPVFRFSHALVLVEHGEPGSPLECVVAQPRELTGMRWPSGRVVERVLGGRVTATLGNGAADDRRRAADGAPSPEQPALYVPLGVRDRRGLLLLLRPEGDEGFDRRDVALARRFSLLASHAFATRSANRNETERNRLRRLTEELQSAQAALSHRANYDQLTGLPNRAYFEDHVVRALRGPGGEQRRLALAFIDLDGFKQVNDLYGHEVGDGLLTAVAERVRGQIRSTDMLARISGDEFVLLIDPLGDRTSLDRIVERVLAALKEPFTVTGHRLMVSASIGLAIHPEHGADYGELRRNADMAMYSAKSSARGSAAYFDAELGRAAANRTELEQVLRRAVRERSFRCVLQPIIDLEAMAITGFEALARRVDDDGALRAPAEFLELAGQLGLLDEITGIVIDDVVACLPLIDHHFGADTTLSLNVSPRQATDPETMTALLRRLAETGRADRFVLEVTEDALLEAARFEREILPLLREFGVRASIDDFGTGYASLSTLLDITPSELKIDRTFISGIHEKRRSRVILEGLAAATRALGVSAVAEGVETEAELHYLIAETSIRAAQGYLFARPMPLDDLIAARPEIEARLRRLAGVSAPPASARPGRR